MKRLLLLAMLLMCSIGAWATVPDIAYSVTFTCAGSLGPYPFTFPISDPTALTVEINGSVVAPTNYTTVAVNNNYNNGGSVTFTASYGGCPSMDTLLLIRATPKTQTVHYYDNMPIPMSTFERSLDKLTEITQEVWGETVHSVQMQVSGSNYLGPASGGTIIFNFANCSVVGSQTGTEPNTISTYNITCNGGGGGGLGTVTTTGSPVSGNLSKFSAPTVITNGDLSGDATTSGTLAVTVTRINGIAFVGSSGNLVQFGVGNTPADTSLVAGDVLKYHSPGAGIARTSSLSQTVASSELSGDATTSGSNLVTVGRLNGTSLAGLSTGILRNTTATGVPTSAELSGDATTSGSNVVTVSKINGTSFAGTNGDLVKFGAANIPVDTGILATSITPVMNISGTIQASSHKVIGTCVLGTSCAVTLTGAAVYTSSSSYVCVGVDQSTAAAVKVAQSSGSAFTLTGTGTDTLGFVCTGN